MRKFQPACLTMIAGAVLGWLMGTAFGGVVDSAGGGLVSRHVRTQTDVSAYPGGTVFTKIPGAEIFVRVPAGSTRLVLARFTAESQCSGPLDKYCAIRIVAFNRTTRSTAELHPQVGLNHVFQRTQSDRFESHTIARAARLSSGSYSIIVQQATTTAPMTFILDDWIFEVDMNL
jgi:hypothetical protein